MRNKLLVLIFLLSAGLVIGPSFAAGQFLVMKHPMVGKAVKDFSLRSVSGENRTLSEIRGQKPAIVFFWATWCPHCRGQLKAFATEKEAMQKKGIALVLVNLEESPEKVKKFLSGMGVEDICLIDPEGEVADQYGIPGVPTLYFIAADGKVRAVEHHLPENYDQYLE